MILFLFSTAPGYFQVWLSADLLQNSTFYSGASEASWKVTLPAAAEQDENKKINILQPDLGNFKIHAVIFGAKSLNALSQRYFTA